MGEIIKLETGDERTKAGKDAGDGYTNELQTITGNLNEDTGQSLGVLVENQLKMTEAETEYNVKSGIPGKATKAVNEASSKIARAAG